MVQYQRGDRVRLLGYGGREYERRVWRDFGRGVAICTEERFQQALNGGTEPVCVGWPREDVLEVLEAARAEPGGQDGEYRLRSSMA